MAAMVHAGMSDKQSDHLNLPPLSDEIVVYRAVRSNSWFHPETGDVLDLAFYLREDNEKGISVNYNCEAEEVEKAQKTCYGVVSLEVGNIHRADERLVVKPVPRINALDHAEIRGMPHKEDDEDLAKYFADLLAGISNTVFQRKYKRKDLS